MCRCVRAAWLINHRPLPKWTRKKAIDANKKTKVIKIHSLCKVVCGIDVKSLTFIEDNLVESNTLIFEYHYSKFFLLATYYNLCHSFTNELGIELQKWVKQLHIQIVSLFWFSCNLPFYHKLFNNFVQTKNNTNGFVSSTILFSIRRLIVRRT